MPAIRKIRKVLKSKPTIEGAGVHLKRVFGFSEVSGIKGPVQDIVIDPEYMDVRVLANSEFGHPTKQGCTVFAYIIDGQGYFCRGKNPFTY